MSGSQNPSLTPPTLLAAQGGPGQVTLSWTVVTPPPPVGNEWVFGGSAQGIVVSNYASANTYLSWLPDWYSNEDAQITTSAYPNGPGPLTRLFDMIGYETDWIRTEIDSFSTLSSAEYISGAMLPYLGGNYGVQYEAELGMTRSRVLVRNAVTLYKTKGIPGNDLYPGGISGAASAFSGYGAVVTLGKNLEIQLDDCAFDRSVGHWTPTNVLTKIEVVSTSSVPGVGGYGFLPYHALYSPVPADYADDSITGYLPAFGDNVLSITAHNSIASISTCTEENATTLGIPCIPQATPQLIVLSAAVCPFNPYATNLHSWYMQIDWYGRTGNYIGSTAGSPVTEIPPPTPLQPGAQWVQMSVTGYPPPGAFFFGRTIASVGILNGLSGTDFHLIDAEQVELNTQATPGPSSWEPPRDIKINLLPIRRNLIPNPVGLGGTYGWATTQGTIAPLTNNVTIGWPGSTQTGFEITSASDGAFQLSTAMFSVYPDDVYSFSFYLKSTLTTCTAYVSTTYYDAYGNGYTGPFSSITAEIGSFVRMTLPGFAVPEGMTNVSFTISSTTTAPDETIYLGAPLFAPESTILPYFDANFFPATDYIWEGVINQSISDYYPQLTKRLSRLVTSMPEYIPIGSTFSLIIAPQAYVNAYGTHTYISPPAPPPPPIEPPRAPVLLEAVSGNEQVTLYWTTVGPPATPTMVVAIPGPGEVLLSWSE